MNSGFIYASLIIGLMLFSSLSILFFPIFSVNEAKLALNNDYKLIAEQINLLRNCAISYGKSQLKFNENQMVTSCNDHQETFVITSNLTSNFPNDQISFNAWGNISRAGAITLKKGTEQKTITLHIGGGYE